MGGCTMARPSNANPATATHRGKRGEAKEYDQRRGRYAVQLDEGGAPLLLKPENLMSRPVRIAAEDGVD